MSVEIIKYFFFYYRLSYSYEGTDAGQTTDALIDMTGEFFSMKLLNRNYYYYCY